MNATVNVPVFPCINAPGTKLDKSPAVASGFKAARVGFPIAEDQLTGVPTGAASGYDVLDIDPRKGGDIWLKANEHRLPSTAWRMTRSGGFHFLFKARPGLRCSADAIARGVDVRAEGGYVIDWTRHGFDQFGEELAEWPDWLLTEIVRAQPAACNGEPVDLGRRRPPSAEAVVKLIGEMSNGPDVDRDTYIRVMTGAKGCIDALGADDGISEAAIAWAEKYGGDTDERAKWEDDWAKRDAPLAGWQSLQRAAAGLVPGYSETLAAERLAEAQAEFSAMEPAPEPIPVSFWNPWEDVVCGPPFPMDLLPPQLSAIVDDTHERIGTDRAACAMAYIAGIAGAIHAETSLRAMQHSDWREHPRLWVALVGDPSSKKSPILSRIVRPYREHEAALRAGYEFAYAEWEAQPKAARGKPPAPPTVLFNDVTPEKAAELLQPRGALMYADELAGWIGNMDKYTGKSASARPFWLQAYEGGSYRQDRITRGHVYVPNLSISLLGGIQLDRLVTLSKADGLTDDGLLQRFLPVVMEPATHSTDRPATVDHAWYTDYVRALLTSAPKEWVMDAEGHAIKEAALRRYQERTLRARHSNKAFSGWMGKAQAFLIRVALVLRYLDPSAPDDGGHVVPAATVRQAVRLLDEFLIPHARAFYYGLAKASREDSMGLAGWILARPPAQTAIMRADFTSGPRSCRGLTERELREKLSPFVAGGWLTPATPHPDCAKWEIAPTLRDVFAEEAKAASEDLKQARLDIEQAVAARRVERSVL